MPLITSVGELRGFENWPATLPSFTIGKCDDTVNIKDTCKITLNKSLILSGWNSSKLSAQSPPWNKKAFPSLTSLNKCLSVRVSPANTSGGNFEISFKTSLSLPSFS